MKTINILIIEDDFLNRRLCKNMLLEYDYNILEADCADEAFDILNNHKIDIVIIDIHLGENATEDGISIAEKINQNYQLPFIFLTAYDHLQIFDKAIITQPTSYLTKPFKGIDLLASIKVALKYKEDKKPKAIDIKLRIKEENYHIDIPILDIDYIESDKNYLMIHSQKKIYKYRGTIKQILEKLPEDCFIQTHRAFIVNKQKIQKFSTNNIIINNTNIPASKSYLAFSRLIKE